jgi:hypothetical protein
MAARGKISRYNLNLSTPRLKQGRVKEGDEAGSETAQEMTIQGEIVSPDQISDDYRHKLC